MTIWSLGFGPLTGRRALPDTEVVRRPVEVAPIIFVQSSAIGLRTAGGARIERTDATPDLVSRKLIRKRAAFGAR